MPFFWPQTVLGPKGEEAGIVLYYLLYALLAFPYVLFAGPIGLLGGTSCRPLHRVIPSER